MPEIDPASPTPLYHQIAESIRARIASGGLREGDTLPSLREAAERWGVNLHTVRHAYAALARDGVVETRRAHGTRVRTPSGWRRSKGRDSGESVESFVSRFVREAGSRHGLSARELAAAVLESGRGGSAADRAVVHVVECSVEQCRDHARELTEAYAVEARPWCLRDHDVLPEGDVVATYFHYNEIRRRWPERLAGVRFAQIGPDPVVRDSVRRASGKRAGRVVLYEFDEPTAEAVASDLSVVLPAGTPIETRVIRSADDALAIAGERDCLLFPPRVWGGLSERHRGDARVVKVRYTFAAGELDAIGRGFGWSPAAVEVLRSR